MFSLIQLAAAACVLGLLLWAIRPRSKPGPFPPGPPADHLLGHARIVPAVHPELTYIKWGKEYNTDILGLNILGSPVIILNSLTAANELLDRRGAKYSGRPSFAFMEEEGWENNLAFFDAGPQFKKHRRFFHNAFNTKELKRYQTVELREARRTALRLLDNPDMWRQHIARYATSIIMGIAYGLVLDDNGPYFHIAGQMTNALSNGGAVGVTAVDVFPFIRRFPRWFKLIPSLNFARNVAPDVVNFREVPYHECKNDIESGKKKPSFVEKMLGDLARDSDDKTTSYANDDNPVTEKDIMGAAATMFAGGQDTTDGTTIVFILAMMLNPSIQAKAWAEIDAVVGKDRLPTFDDQSKLPYIQNIIRECMRWKPVVPLGVPHKTTENDTYQGYFIPKGTTVFANSFAMLQDPSIYSNPKTFNPSRYLPLSAGGLNEPHPIGQFGFGRRICPGKDLAHASLSILISTLLATVSFAMKRDERGDAIVPSDEVSCGLTSHPVAFECVVRPRGVGVKELVVAAGEEVGS